MPFQKGNQIRRGKTFSVASRLKMSRSHTGVRISISTKKKMSAASLGKRKSAEHARNIAAARLGRPHPGASRPGALHPNWQGGKTSEAKRLRNSVAYKRWREACMRRDNYTCRWPGCGKRGGPLEVDHIMQFAHYEDLRFEVYNGRTLCKPCHKKHGSKSRTTRS